jgi:hypothetical protein
LTASRGGGAGAETRRGGLLGFIATSRSVKKREEDPDMAALQQQTEGVIKCFTNEGEGFMRMHKSHAKIVNVTYTGGLVAGKADGRGTARFNGGSRFKSFNIYDAEFRSGIMQPCTAVLKWFGVDGGDVFSGNLTPDLCPAEGARGVYIRSVDGGRFQGRWPASGNGTLLDLSKPLDGVAWIPTDGSVHSVTLAGQLSIATPEWWAGEADLEDLYCWLPGADPRWRRIGIMERPAPGQAQPPTPPRRATRPAPARALDAALVCP